MFKEVLDRVRRLDFLVNNAGIQIADDSDMLDVGRRSTGCSRSTCAARSCARSTRSASLLDDERGGAIVNVSSRAPGDPEAAVRRLLGVARAGCRTSPARWRSSTPRRGIRVNGIGPGATVTPINRAWIDDPVKRRGGRAATSRCAGPATPRRWPRPSRSCCSDEAAYITGQTLFVDGGLTLYPTSAAPGQLGVSWYRRGTAPTTRPARSTRSPPTRSSRRRRWSAPGRVFDLAHVLDADVPAFPGRSVPPVARPPDHGTPGRRRNEVNWIVEHVTATQQMGTHLDGLNHLHVGDRTYNGHRLADIAEDRTGTTRLGIDTLPQVVTRGLLLDIAAVRGVDRLDPGEVITPRRRRAGPRRGRARGPARRRGAVPHRLGPALGRRPRPPTRAGEPGPGIALASGSSSIGSRSPAATRGATARTRPRTRTRRSSCRRRSTSATASSWSRTSGSPSSPRRGVAEFLFVVVPRQAARRHRRVGRTAGDHLIVQASEAHPCPTTTTSS